MLKLIIDADCLLCNYFIDHMIEYLTLSFLTLQKINDCNVRMS